MLSCTLSDVHVLYVGFNKKHVMLSCTLSDIHVLYVGLNKK